MRIYPDCFPCFYRQVLLAFDQTDVSEDHKLEILRDVSEIISGSDLEKSPAHVTTLIHRKVREKLMDDPFRAIRSVYNAKAMDLYDDMKGLLHTSGDPLFTAVRLAIAGNIIDFGIYSSVDMEGTIKKALQEAIAVDDYDKFKNSLENAGSLLYLLDNAGEVVFDKLLIEILVSSGVKVTAVVKGGPVINDAVMADAYQTGLDDTCRIIDNGSDAVGTIFQWCSNEFVNAFKNAELIISKGQGNFETLMHTGRDDIFFLFQAKCDVVASHLGLNKGSMVLSRGLDHWNSGV